MALSENDATPNPLVDKLMAVEERWDEACGSIESPALRERHLAHAEKQLRDLGRSDEPFTRSDLAARINEIDS